MEFIKKRFLVCLAGVILSAVLFSALIEADVIYNKMNGSAPVRDTQNISEVQINQMRYEHAVKTSQRIDFIYLPIVLLFTALSISLVENGKARLPMILISSIPILLFHIIASSFSLKECLLISGYLVFAMLIGIGFPKSKDGRTS